MYHLLASSNSSLKLVTPEQYEDRIIDRHIKTGNLSQISFLYPKLLASAYISSLIRNFYRHTTCVAKFCCLSFSHTVIFDFDTSLGFLLLIFKTSWIHSPSSLLFLYPFIICCSREYLFASSEALLKERTWWDFDSLIISKAFSDLWIDLILLLEVLMCSFVNKHNHR